MIVHIYITLYAFRKNNFFYNYFLLSSFLNSDILPPINGVGFLCVMQSLHPATDVFYQFSVRRGLPPVEALHPLPERDFPSVRG